MSRPVGLCVCLRPPDWAYAFLNQRHVETVSCFQELVLRLATNSLLAGHMFLITTRGGGVLLVNCLAAFNSSLPPLFIVSVFCVRFFVCVFFFFFLGGGYCYLESLRFSRSEDCFCLRTIFLSFLVLIYRVRTKWGPQRNNYRH